MGAESSQIYSRMTKEYIVLIFIANLITIPFGILSGEADPSYYKQADNYSQLFWVMILSILITMLTISIQVIKSSRANPVESLRYE